MTHRKQYVKKRAKKQKRFLCSKCKNQLYLKDSYCDRCGGKINWPDRYFSLMLNQPRQAPPKHPKLNSYGSKYKEVTAKVEKWLNSWG